MSKSSRTIILNIYVLIHFKYIQYTVYCILYIVYCILYIVSCILYIVYCTEMEILLV